MAACFKDVVESDQVALNVDIRVIDGVADAGLRGKIDHDRWPEYCEYFVDESFVCDAASDENMPDRRVDRVDNAEAVFLELRIIVIIHVVEADHSAAGQLAAKAHDEIGADKAGRAGDQDCFAVQIDGGFAHCLFLVGVIAAGDDGFIAVSISAENVSCVDFFLDIVENGIIAVGDDASAHFLEFPEVIDDLGAKESRAVLKCGFVNNDGSALRLDALHDALDGGLPEVVGICFHGQAVYADDDVFLFALFVAGVRLAVAVSSGNLQNTVRDKVFSGAISLDDRLDEVLRHVLIVGEQLLGIFWQAVTAVAKGRIVVIITDPGIETDALDDLGGVQSFDLGVCVQFVEVADAEREIGVHEELRGFGLGEAHEKGIDILLVGALLQQRGEDVGLLSGVVGGFIIADDDPAGIQVVIQGLGFAQELRAEQNVVDAELLADVPGVTYRDGRLNDDRRLILGRSVFCRLHDKFYDRFHSAAVKEVLLGIIVGRRCYNDKIGISVSLSRVRGRLKVQLSRSLLRFSKKLLDILVFDRRFIVVELLYLLLDDVHCGYIVVLGKEYGEGQTDVAGSGDGDLVGS